VWFGCGDRHYCRCRVFRETAAKRMDQQDAGVDPACLKVDRDLLLGDQFGCDVEHVEAVADIRLKALQGQVVAALGAGLGRFLVSQLGFQCL